jgi:hypothetical protein
MMPARPPPPTAWKGLEHDVRRTVSIRCLQSVANLPLRRPIKPLFCHRRPAHIARESFELVALFGLHADAGMQRKPGVLRHPFPRLLRSRRHGL